MSIPTRPRTLVTLSAAVVVVAAVVFLLSRRATPVPLIGLTQIVSHPSLDSVRAGIVEGLKERGFVDGVNVRIEFRNANGDATLTVPIAQAFVSQGAKVIVPIATPSALGAAQATRTIPIVFGGVTDPIGVRLIASLAHPGGNITGTSDRWPFEGQLRLFKALMPSLRRLGIMYRPGDDVSKIAVDALRELAPRFGIQLELRPVSSSADIYPTAVSLFQRLDALYTGLDNLVVENLESVVRAGREARKPVFGGDAGSVGRGAVAALSIDMNDLGVLTGNMVADVLQGARTDTMAVRVVTKGRLVVNTQAAAAAGIDTTALTAVRAQFRY